jgi:hypothetical protein
VNESIGVVSWEINIVPIPIDLWGFASPSLRSHQSVATLGLFFSIEKKEENITKKIFMEKKVGTSGWISFDNRVKN